MKDKLFLIIRTIGKHLYAISRWMGENAFLGFLVLFLVALFLSSAVFYKYVFLLQGVEVLPEPSQSRFESTAFQEVLRIWDSRRVKFGEASAQEYRDIFAPSQPQD